MTAKKLTHKQILSERALAKTRVTPLDRPSTNHLIEYFNNSQYLDNNDRVAIDNKPKAQVQHYPLAVVSQPNNITKSLRLRLGLVFMIFVLFAGGYSFLSNLTGLQITNAAFAKSNAQSNARSSLKQQLITSRSESPSQVYLQSMAINIMKDENWDIQKTHYFKRSWSNLLEEQKAEYRNLIWFQLFENALIRELGNIISDVENYSYATSIREKALLALAKSLNIEAPTTNNPSIDNTVSSGPTSAQLETETKTAKITKTNKTAPENPKAKPVHIASIGDLTRLSIESMEPPTDNTSSNKPTEDELDSITAQFVNSYEVGDIKHFLSLFTKDIISNSHKDIEGLKSQYAELFDNTAERQMILHDLKWRFKKQTAIGKAKMELSSVSTTNSEEIEQYGRLQLVAEKHQDKIVFTRFYILTE